jgi:hypothetical protein
VTARLDEQGGSGCAPAAGLAAEVSTGSANPARRVGALAFAAAALVGVALAWGFSVDDALISGRVAHHLANGLGYRFNPTGARVDCVTPLGWAPLLAPLALGTPWQAITRASVGGAALWIMAAGWLGRRCAAECTGWRLGALALVLATCLPLGAWASSGMETALVMALATFALAPTRWGAACAGLAAAWRPELVPWALALALGQAIARGAPSSERLLSLALALTPALLVALCRQALFGHPAPLAVFAKPSDMAHGLRYALGSALLAGPPYLLLAGRSWRAVPRSHVALALALGVHWVVLAGVGGDWMPFWRLAMPAIPGVLLLGSALLGVTPSRLWAARFVPVFACAALLHAAQGKATRAVRSERARLIAELPPLLGGARRVASLDVGWVGAAGDYEVIDLAGVTDPEVAYLSGGHTSKRLPPDFLVRHDVDALVLLRERPPGGRAANGYARQVENRVLTLRGADELQVVGELLLDSAQSYVVLRRGAMESQTVEAGP